MTNSPKLKLILGSSSPRRKDLLSRIGLSFEVIRPEVEERHRPGERPQDYVVRNAREKADWVVDFLASRGDSHVPYLVISADTIVVRGDQILEKTRDRSEAGRMLASLSGRVHTVVSGVALKGSLADETRERVFAVETKVFIKALSSSEIESYIKTGEPLDKAGAYAAQGIGSYMVKEIQGSYTNVVGLPMAEVVEALEQDFALGVFGG